MAKKTPKLKCRDIVQLKAQIEQWDSVRKKVTDFQTIYKHTPTGFVCLVYHNGTIQFQGKKNQELEDLVLKMIDEIGEAQTTLDLF